jgi:hypothetical protein
MAFNRPPNDRSLTFKEIATDARIPLDEVNMYHKLYDSLLNLDVFHRNGKSIGQYLYCPTLELFCFSFTQPFTHSKFCLPNPFFFGATPRHKL